MRVARLFSAIGLVCLSSSLVACRPAAERREATEAPASVNDEIGSLAEEPAPSLRLKDLGATARRVSIIVLPGDAAVEVDGVGARRRDGVIELVGNLGELHRLRIFKGLQAIEKDVKIEEAGASPAFVDLNAPPP